MTIHFSWFILLLSVDLADSALIVQNTLNRYCNTDAVDIYATIDNVTQDTTLSTAQAVEKCRLACQSAYAYTSPAGGGFTIGTDEAGCSDTDKCRCRSSTYDNCNVWNRATLSGNCFESHEFEQPIFSTTIQADFLEIVNGATYVDLVNPTGGTTKPLYCVETVNYPQNYLSSMSATVKLLRPMTMRDIMASGGFEMESSSSCAYDRVSMGSTIETGFTNHQTGCKQNAALSVGGSSTRCTSFCGTQGPPDIQMDIDDTIIVVSDGSVQKQGFRICANGLPATGVNCVASSDPAQTTVDPVTGDFFCVDGDISGTVATGCTCTPKACIIQSPMTEAWHKNCRSDSTATGTAGNCKCSCVEDAWGGDKSKGGRCITDVDECTNNPNTFPHRATERCSPQAACTNRGINNGYDCDCLAGWEDAVTFEAVDQTECLLQSTIDAVKDILPPSRPYGSSGAGNEQLVNVNWKGEGCIFYTLDPTYGNSGANDRIVFNTGTFTTQADNRASYSICKCADCDQTYHLVTTPYQACSAYTPTQGHACVRKTCIVGSNTADAEIPCVNGAAAGVFGSCTCVCDTDASGKPKWTGALCDVDVDECTNTDISLARDNCDANDKDTCTDTDGGFTCGTCANEWTTIAGGSYVQVTDSAECMTQALHDNVILLVPDEFGANLQYGTVIESSQSWNFVGENCVYYTDTTGDGSNNRVLFNSGDFTNPIAGKESFPVCKCATCEETYIVLVDNTKTCEEITCSPTVCTVDATPTENYEIACANGATAAGVSGRCTCDCPVDGSGKFLWEGTLCDTDVNECTETDPANAQHNCDLTNGGCTNTDGGFTCTCNAGYTLNADGFTCDAAPCVIGSDSNNDNTIDCQNGATAAGTTGSCTCVCPQDGFNRDLWFGGTCGNDVDECTNTNPARAVHSCINAAQCIDEDGGHDCICSSTASPAQDGMLDGEVIYCANSAQPLGTKNTGCSCDCSTTGSLWNGTNCDECTNTGAGCLVGGNAGVFSGQCRCVCPLIQQHQNGNNALVFIAYGAVCENDVNECTNVPGSVGYDSGLATNTCSDDATCTDLVGSANPTVQGWSCACNYGFEGDGETCTLKQCVQADPAVEDWEINCVNGDVVGSSGSCACDCPTGYDGLDTWKFTFCGTDVDECTNTNPLHSSQNCDTNAVCGNIDGGFTCTCNAGYSGDGVTCTADACTVTTNFLENNPSEGVIWCSGNGVAAGNTGSCTCVCDAGYSGTNCETTLSCTLDSVDDSQDGSNGVMYCKYGAVTGDYFNCGCICFNDFSGTHCDECVPATPGCQNGATAADIAGTCSCVCPSDSNGLFQWFGGTCGNNVNECTNTNPSRAVDNCNTFATCGDTPGSFTCTCNAGYSGNGTHCEADDCVLADPADDPWEITGCQNGATAGGTTGQCFCDCAEDFFGLKTWFGGTCGNDVDECTNTNPGRAVHNCSADATCGDIDGGFTCTCNPGYAGDGVTCDFAPCEIGDPNVQINYIDCLNGATASGVANSCTCDCATDYLGLVQFFGTLCAGDVNECFTNPALDPHRSADNCSANALCTNLVGGFSCSCDAGYSGDGVVCTADPCIVSVFPQSNHISCVYGTANGVADACTCDCVNGFTGTLCDECVAGKGYNGTHCAACTDTQANDLTTHAAPCADQQCGAGFGVNTDSFDFTLDPTNTGTANCVACTGKQASPAGNGVCITQTCGDDEQVVSTGFDSALDPTSSNANCEACAAGFESTAGVDPTCTDINECISTDNPNFPELCDFTGTLAVAGCNTDDGPNTRNCVCKPGYEGDRCEIDINECDPNPCQNGASCIDLIADYTCICPLNSHESNPVAGWTGKNCTDDVNECDSFITNDCDFGESTCINLLGDFTCQCNAEYDDESTGGPGRICTIKPCELGNTADSWTIDCNGRGDPFAGTTAGNCFCACTASNSIGGQAWTGTNCENNQNECNMPGNNNCDANAQCTDTIGDFFCTCDAEYDGDGVTCELKQCVEADTPDSWTIDCNGNANITGVAGSCGCDCNATNSIGGLAYSGTNCETNINECSDPQLNDCDPDATCTDTDGDFTCACNTGYEFAHYVQVSTTQECFSSEVIDAVENTIVPAQFGPNEQYGNQGEASGDWGWVGQNCVYYTNVNQQVQNRLIFSTTPQTSTQNGKTSYQVCKCDTCTNDKYAVVSESVLISTCDDLNFKTCTESDCVTSDVATTTPGEMYCLHGNASGVTGSCACVCEDGWEGTNCDQDVNECLNPLLNVCLPYHICNNTPGTYSCLCKFGFISTVGDPPVCTCDVGRHYNASEGTCRDCEYPTTNDQQNSECVHAECLQNQYIEPDDGSFTNFLPYDHVSNCAACWPGTFSDNTFSTECDDINECDAGIAATCGEFDDNGTLVPMGVCNESSQDDTIALTFFRCTPNPGFECPPNNGPCTDTTECDTNPCTGGPNTASCDDTYTSADPTGFRCTCNPGYSGALCETADTCNATLNSNDLGLDGNYYCRYGDIGGITGTCICTCNDGFTGSHCDVCVAGSGFFNDTCELCSNPFTNDQITHDAPCVNQSCGVDRGIVVDGLAFSNLLDGNVDNANCEDCPPGMESPAGSGICSAIICGANEKVVNHACVPCETGSLNLDGGDDASGNNTECDGVPCVEDERVEANVCVSCPPGTTNAAGDLRNGPDTFCDPILCLEDEKVVNNACVPCQPGAENEAGDDASGPNTACIAILCDVNEYVSANNCTPCAPLYVNLAGDDATQPDTQCILGCLPNEGVINNLCVPCEDSYVYPGLANPEGPDVDCIYEGTCGNGDIGFVWCDENNTYICANDMCACKPGFVGRECTADALADDSPSTQKKKDLLDIYAPDEALPDDDTIIIFQQNVAVHLSDIVTGFVQQGGNTIDNVFQHTVEINRLTQRQQVIAGDRKTLLAAAPMLDDDDCALNGALSRYCSSFNYRGVNDDIVFLQTPKGFWSVVVKAETLVSKQTSINNTDFEMQCWAGSGWGPKVTRYRDDLVMCNGFVLLMGSQAPICQATVTEPTGHILPGTCGLHGQCAIDGLSYTCICSPGFTGEFCEQVYVQPTHCHEVDCNNYGGHNASVGLVPSPMLQTDVVPYCCNYDTRADFDQLCDAETQAQAYANLGCCARTFCI